MAYLGRGLDKISNIEVLDNITFDGSSSYSITKGSVAFTPNSAQSCLISIDGVVQATNFSVNSSTIDFGVAIQSTSVCNFFLHYGTGVMTVPSDGSVTTAKLGNSAVDLTSKVTGALPVANGGTALTSGFKNGITEADQWRWTADFTGNAEPVTANWERNDTSFDKIGTGMSESSGTFTFPQTGIYKVNTGTYYYLNADSRYNEIVIRLSTNGGSSYSSIAYGYTSITRNSNLTTYANASTEAMIDVTNTSNFKVQISISHHNTNSSVTAGSSTYNANATTFIRLGDT
jgi:hypothetical protein